MNLAIHDIILAHQNGVMISPKDALLLSQAKGEDLRNLLAYANELCGSIHGKRVSFVVNRNINFTNACSLQCRFCAFSVTPGHPRSYLLSFDAIRQKVREAQASNCTEVCIQGGLHPQIKLDYYIGILRTVREIAPKIHIHAFSPQEIYYMHQRSHESIETVLRILQKEGLGSIPGTAAEILVDEVRQQLCPNKITSLQWQLIIQTAHRLGLPTTSTMMFGSIENWSHRCAHLEVVRAIQQETRGFTEFVPLPFINPHNDFWKAKRTETLVETELLKLYAIARIYFHGIIPNIQTSWVKLGPTIAQKTLNCGVNDFGGTLMEENISKSAGAKHGESLSPEQIKEYIRAANKIPVERNTVYEIIREFNS